MSVYHELLSEMSVNTRNNSLANILQIEWIDCILKNQLGNKNKWFGNFNLYWRIDEARHY